jgi:hypothetical protein
MDARGYFKRRPDTGQPWADTQDGVLVAGSLRTTLLTLLLFSITHDNNVRRRLRGCGMSETDEAALAALRRRIAGEAPILDANARKMMEASQRTQAARKQRAAADVARHGLRACALPECDAVEPQPKTFKLCSRCLPRRVLQRCASGGGLAPPQTRRRLQGGCIVTT